MKHDCGYFYGRSIEIDMKGKSERIKFCPVCGNLVEENNPLTLQEFDKHRNMPIYVVCKEYPQLNGWYIVHKDKQTKRIECWGYDSTKFDSKNYGDVWLAYLREKYV